MEAGTWVVGFPCQDRVFRASASDSDSPRCPPPGALWVLRMGVPWPFLAGKGGSCRAQHSQSHVSGRCGDSTAGRWLPQVSISHTCCQLLIGGLAVVGAGSHSGSSQLVAVDCESAESWHVDLT